ncbi:FadR/GntR family transcriptional regulator [Taklimakanibacter deserti]|uniref:FadR/GntR family transcriptional regulator n=1 Tax=Taklimakanibacter deserti TaxID=2267839 RepID=UPI0034D4A224
MSGSLHGMVLNQIGQRILRGDLTPGDALPNADDWSAAEGVSRTVLREALKVLAGKGLVESRPKTGTRVRPRSHWNFLDPDVLAWRYATAAGGDEARALFELRRGIEPMAAALAAERATPEQVKELESALAEMEETADDAERFAEPDLVFHQSILRMTGNELIGSLAAVIETALVMSFRLSNDNPRGQRHSLPLHRDVVRKIAAKDAEGARQSLLTLLDQAEEDVRRSLDARRGRQSDGE